MASTTTSGMANTLVELCMHIVYVEHCPNKTTQNAPMMYWRRRWNSNFNFFRWFSPTNTKFVAECSRDCLDLASRLPSVEPNVAADDIQGARQPGSTAAGAFGAQRACRKGRQCVEALPASLL